MYISRPPQPVSAVAAQSCRALTFIWVECIVPTLYQANTLRAKSTRTFVYDNLRWRFDALIPIAYWPSDTFSPPLVRIQYIRCTKTILNMYSCFIVPVRQTKNDSSHLLLWFGLAYAAHGNKSIRVSYFRANSNALTCIYTNYYVRKQHLYIRFNIYSQITAANPSA